MVKIKRSEVTLPNALLSVRRLYGCFSNENADVVVHLLDVADQTLKESQRVLERAREQFLRFPPLTEAEGTIVSWIDAILPRVKPEQARHPDTDSSGDSGG